MYKGLRGQHIYSACWLNQVWLYIASRSFLYVHHSTLGGYIPSRIPLDCIICHERLISYGDDERGRAHYDNIYSRFDKKKSLLFVEDMWERVSVCWCRFNIDLKLRVKTSNSNVSPSYFFCIERIHWVRQQFSHENVDYCKRVSDKSRMWQ
jgi:hypothetical protein